jgi:hypothetical protein
MHLLLLFICLLAVPPPAAAANVHPMTKHDQESQRPMHARRGEHFLNQLDIISTQGKEAAYEKIATEENTSSSTPVYITLNVRSIRAIDASEESYQLRCHLYLMWGVDFHNDPEWKPFKKTLYERAIPLDYYPMSDEEFEKLSASIRLPSFRFANAKEVTPTDDRPSLRIYANDGSEKSKGIKDDSSFVMWNQGFEVTLSTHFPLHKFPFDSQDLFVSIRQDDSRSWDKYNLTMTIVQFHKEAIEMAEWELYEPRVARGSPGICSNVTAFVYSTCIHGKLIFFFSPFNQVTRKHTCIYT